MKIRTAKDVEKLDLRIKEELGIDVHQYRDDQVAENLVELLNFPEYAISSIVKPVIFVFLIFITGFFIIDLVHVEYLLYGVLGSALFVIVGFTLGLLFLIGRMKYDMWGVIKFTFSIMQNAISDLNDLGHQITQENRAQVLSLLFNGIIHIVTIPMLSKILGEGIPVFGRVFSWIMKKVLTGFSDKINFHDEAFAELEKLEMEESKGIQTVSSGLDMMSGGLEKILNVTFNIARFPIGFIFTVAFIMLYLLLYLIW